MANNGTVSQRSSDNDYVVTYLNGTDIIARIFRPGYIAPPLSEIFNPWKDIDYGTIYEQSRKFATKNFQHLNELQVADKLDEADADGGMVGFIFSSAFRTQELSHGGLGHAPDILGTSPAVDWADGEYKDMFLKEAIVTSTEQHSVGPLAAIIGRIAKIDGTDLHGTYVNENEYKAMVTSFNSTHTFDISQVTYKDWFNNEAPPDADGTKYNIFILYNNTQFQAIFVK